MTDVTKTLADDQQPDQQDDEQSGIQLHMGIAEQGKLYAVKGDHKKALLYYREAMNMTVQAGDPEVFFRHYLECVIESLEQTDSYDEVLDFCDKVIQHYTDNPPPNPVAIMDLAHTYQRKGVVLMKLGEKDIAGDAFRYALELVKGIGQVTSETLPLTQTLLRWIETNMHVDKNRILSEQQRNDYFTVRRDTVDAAKAVKLPHEASLMQGR